MNRTSARRLLVGATITALAALAVGCGGSDPLSDDAKDTGGGTIVVGSQDYYSNEIIAEIYAQVLEREGYEVKRELRIGQREVYMPEIERGAIDLFPEYTGPLLEFWDSDTSARMPDAVYKALVDAAPDGIRILDQADATDQDSYVVTRSFAKRHGLKTIADLAKVPGRLTLGANSEGENRPNGPKGLKRAYGIEAGFTPIEDGGGPLTVKALKDDRIQLAIIYTADPSIASNDLVVLEDPEGLFLASHVVPIASDKLDEPGQALINRVSAALSAPELVALNARSVRDQAAAKKIAADWIKTNDAALSAD